jgi:hypothetical protein
MLSLFLDPDYSVIRPVVWENEEETREKNNGAERNLSLDQEPSRQLIGQAERAVRRVQSSPESILEYLWLDTEFSALLPERDEPS